MEQENLKQKQAYKRILAPKEIGAKKVMKDLTSINLPSENVVTGLQVKDGKKRFEPNQALYSSVGNEFNVINNYDDE